MKVDEDIYIEDSAGPWYGGMDYFVGGGEPCPDWITVEQYMSTTYYGQVWWYFDKNDGTNAGGTEIVYQ
ncbi:MAG: hypothetical protein ACFFD4_34590 [Candidatus Odinarchaeota archaeon]